MVGIPDNLRLATDAIRAHKLRAALTVLGLMMGVATLMTVMTLVLGANVYVEQKIANLGTNVFRVARTPFAVVDFSIVVRALKNKTLLRQFLIGGSSSASSAAQSGSALALRVQKALLGRAGFPASVKLWGGGNWRNRRRYPACPQVPCPSRRQRYLRDGASAEPASAPQADRSGCWPD